MQEEKRVKSCFSLPESQHIAVRVWCAQNGRKVQEVFSEAMTKWIEQNINRPAKGAAK
jgi:hypothetical protein